MTAITFSSIFAKKRMVRKSKKMPLLNSFFFFSPKTFPQIMQLSIFWTVFKTVCRNRNYIIKFNNCPTRCDSFSLLHFCRQLYMFQVLTPIIRSSYNCNYSFWY